MPLHVVLRVLQKNYGAAEKALEKSRAVLEKRQAEMEEAKLAVEQADEELSAVGKQRTQVVKEKGAVARKLTAEETSAEQLRVKRHQLIVKSRVEQVELPVEGGGTTADLDENMLSGGMTG